MVHGITKDYKNLANDPYSATYSAEQRKSTDG